jgi:hypothetical protein
MKQTISLITVAALLSGCVTIQQPDNYRPQTYDMRQAYYRCLHESQQDQASFYAGANQQFGSAYAQAGAKTNNDMLLSCMNAAGYDLRTPSKVETWTTALTSPLWFPFFLFGGAPLVHLGGGNGGP